MCNTDIRNEVKNAGLRLWQVAHEYGIADTNFSKKLRFELSDAEKDKIRAIITKLSKEARV